VVRVAKIVKRHAPPIAPFLLIVLVLVIEIVLETPVGPIGLIGQNENDYENDSDNQNEVR